MTRILPDQVSSKDGLDKAASQWFVLLKNPNVSPHEQEEFNVWYTSAEHRDAYDKVRLLWQGVGSFSDSGIVDRLYKEGEMALSKRSDSRVSEWLSRLLVPIPLVPLSLAAAVLLLVVMVPFIGGVKTYETAVGERRTFSLDDGSIITLNTNTEIDVAYNKKQRLVTLNNGQAFFQVAKDSVRPFVVDAGSGSITAIGTAFDVQRFSTEVTVTLLEGTVNVRKVGAIPKVASSVMPTKSIILTAKVGSKQGQRVSIAQEGFGSIVTTKADVATAWQAGTVIFNATPLYKAIIEINRYLSDKIIIGDQSLNNVRISGVFHTGNQQAVVRALTRYFPMKALKQQDGSIVIVPADDASVFLKSEVS